MDDFLSTNVNSFSGDMVLSDTYALRMCPEQLSVLSAGSACFSYAPELSHIDQLGFKLTTIFRLGRIGRLRVVVKDGSPHSVQIPLIVQEAAQNTSFPLEMIEIFAFEKDRLVQISHPAVRAARHLSEIETLLSSQDAASTALGQAVQSTPPPAEVFVAIVLGGRSDLERLQGSDMQAILERIGITYEVSVISSEQNPEELRSYCRRLAQRNVALVICIAGLVPGLPASVKAQLPFIPILSVPLSVPGFDVTNIMLASFSVPARRPVILSGMDEVGLKKAA